ncbi:MAG: DNA replication and repair protein RecF [Bacilli bacterium]|nr:DNA replication and repair protein RecF [Bacilli bacterium]
MIVKKLTLRNFRNYDYVDVEFDPKLNIIIGDNAAGKTNIVEAIHFLSLARSFRTLESAELIKNRRQFATIEASIEQDTIRKDIVALLTSSSKKFTCNDKPVKKISDLSKLINVLVFQPKDTLMFSDSPLVRRNFLDVNLSKKSPVYLENLMIFEKLLRERNSILKEDNIDHVQLKVVTDQLIDVEETICKYRQAYISEINQILSKIITQLKGEMETAKLEYLPFIKLDDKFKVSCARAYERNEESDIKHKMTQIGIHREDMKMILNGKDISLQGSQGENRIAVIALKIAPFFLIEDKDLKPIIVLDDVMSELDSEHKERLVTFVKGLGQVFITSTNTTVKNASIYEVKQHNITRRNAKW